jgi:hypothetical protein
MEGKTEICMASGICKSVYFNMRVHQPCHWLSYFTLYKPFTLEGLYTLCDEKGLIGDNIKTAIISETSAWHPTYRIHGAVAKWEQHQCDGLKPCDINVITLLLYLWLTQRENPRGGGSEYLHRSPARRRGRRKGNPVSGVITRPPYHWGA